MKRPKQRCEFIQFSKSEIGDQLVSWRPEHNPPQKVRYVPEKGAIGLGTGRVKYGMVFDVSN